MRAEHGSRGLARVSGSLAPILPSPASWPRQQASIAQQAGAHLCRRTCRARGPAPPAGSRGCTACGCPEPCGSRRASTPATPLPAGVGCGASSAKVGVVHSAAEAPAATCFLASARYMQATCKKGSKGTENGRRWQQRTCDPPPPRYITIRTGELWIRSTTCSISGSISPEGAAARVGVLDRRRCCTSARRGCKGCDRRSAAAAGAADRARRRRAASGEAAGRRAWAPRLETDSMSGKKRAINHG